MRPVAIMLNLAVDPSDSQLQPHAAAQYKKLLMSCDSCNHKQEDFLHLPGTVRRFESREAFLDFLITTANKYWDNMLMVFPELEDE